LEKHEYPLEVQAGVSILVSGSGDSKLDPATAAKPGLPNALAGTHGRCAIIDKIA